MKRPIAIGLATVALGIAAPVTYHVSQSAADPQPKSNQVSEAHRAEIRETVHDVRTFGSWLEGAQMVRYAEAANFFDYLQAVEEARQAAIPAAAAAAAAAAVQPSSGGGGNGLDAIRQCES